MPPGGLVTYLYAFIDESGNNDFEPTGTKYWCLTSMVLFDPSAGRDDLFAAKHRILDEGHDLHSFHASADRQVDRDRVFEVLQSLEPEQCRVDSIIVDKRVVQPQLRQLDVFYPLMLEQLLQHQFGLQGVDISQFEKVVVFIDRTPSMNTKQSQAMLKAIRLRLPGHLRGVPYSLFFHPTSSHHGLQMVDYMSWAIYVKHTKAELRPFDKIRHLVASERRR